MRDTDKTWDDLATKDPYFAVLTEDRFHRQNFDAQARLDFFESGRLHVDDLFGKIRKHIDADFRASRALDFGCGTGRIVIPLSKLCDRVVGIDISTAMLEETARNCKEHGSENVDLFVSDDELSQLSGEFDLIHTFIVLQHVPTRRGEEIVSHLLDHLAPSGVAAIHLTYFQELTKARRAVAWARKNVPFANPILRLARIGRPAAPAMQMNSYDLNRVVRTFQEKGISKMHVEFTDHDGYLGVFLYGIRELNQ